MPGQMESVLRTVPRGIPRCGATKTRDLAANVAERLNRTIKYERKLLNQLREESMADMDKNL